MTDNVAVKLPELAYGKLAGELVPVPPFPLLNNIDDWFASNTDVLVNAFGAPTQSGEDTVKEATIGTGTLIVFVIVQEAPVTGSNTLRLITCEPAANVMAEGNGLVESVVA